MTEMTCKCILPALLNIFTLVYASIPCILYLELSPPFGSLFCNHDSWKGGKWEG